MISMLCVCGGYHHRYNERSENAIINPFILFFHSVLYKGATGSQLHPLSLLNLHFIRARASQMGMTRFLEMNLGHGNLQTNCVHTH